MKESTENSLALKSEEESNQDVFQNSKRPELSMETFIKENPAIIDIDKDCGKMLTTYFDNFEKEVLKNNFHIVPDMLSVILAGPRVQDKSGFEPYNSMCDMIAFFFGLILNSPSYLHEKKFKMIWNYIEMLCKYLDDTNTLYDSVIRAIDIYKPNFIDIKTMFSLIVGSQASPISHCNMNVFTEYVPITSMGQIFNYSISRQYRTELILCEIRKGLRSDKITGIPPEDIIEYFIEQDGNDILRKFDINILSINLFIDLFNVKVLDEYIEMQTKNIEYRYNFTNGDNAAEQLNQADIYNRLCEHYTNMKRILNRLLTIKDTVLNVPGINSFTLAYMLIHVPPKSFYVYSSYEALLNQFVYYYTDDVEKHIFHGEYGKLLKTIILLNPNVDIPYRLINVLFSYKDLDILIDGLKLGFARYALYVSNKFADMILLHANGHDICNNKDYDYFKMPYINRLIYIIDKIEPKLEHIKKECYEINNSDKQHCEDCTYSEEIKPLPHDDKPSDDFHYTCRLETDDPIAQVRKSIPYRDFDFINILKKTNDYIKGLTDMLSKAQSSEKK
jgi:hypothetical protein